MSQPFSALKQDVNEVDELAPTTLPGYLGDETASRKTVSAIVPMYDEETTVGGVVNALLNSNLIDEVICVNDGSTDHSLAILRTFEGRITLIDLEQNRGKGYALAVGIREAKGEIVAFFDADLVNLSDRYIETLLMPILDGSTRAVLGYPTKDSVLPTVFADLTGERAYYRQDLLPFLARMETSRFGVEVLLNDAFCEHQPVKVPLVGLRGLYKYEKHSPTKAFREYLGAAIEIAQEIGRIDGLLPEDRQIIAGLADATNFEELRSRVRKIRNVPIRHLLEKYVLNYFR